MYEAAFWLLHTVLFQIFLKEGHVEMKTNNKKYIIAALLSLVCSLSVLVSSVFAAPQGTEGDELQVLEPQQLEVQLGPDWVGKKFSLRTDVGIYPDTIVVGPDGVLRTELGGSKTYTLSCMDVDTGVAEESPDKPESSAKPEENGKISDKSIPKMASILIIGIMAAIAILAYLGRSGKKKDNKSVADDDEEI